MTNRDPAIERLLRETLAGSGGERTDECLVPETLAAWMDGTLDGRARTLAEAHAAGCARCQALVAAMARTEPPACPERSRGVAERSRLSFPAWRWLVPLTAAAAAVVIWVVVPDRSEEQRSALPAPATAAARTPAPSSASAATVTAPPATDTTPSRVDSLAAATPDRKPQAAPKAEPTDRVVGGTRFRGLTVPPEADVAAAAPPTNPAAPQPAPPPPPAAPTTTLAARQGAPAAAARMERAFADAAEIVIPSPDANVRWRILPNHSEVQRSVDGGATWSNQNPGVAAALTAGSAPSPAVCWVVGSRGTVLLTTDGATWNARAFPEPIDLTSVRAADDKTAIVTAADGRRFSTSDGGQTWLAAQENQPAPF